MEKGTENAGKVEKGEKNNRIL